jgi:hypothetical protein
VCVLTPVPALTHGPSGWLLLPTGVWFPFSLFILFVGSGVTIIEAHRGALGEEAMDRETTPWVRLPATVEADERAH